MSIVDFAFLPYFRFWPKNQIFVQTGLEFSRYRQVLNNLSRQVGKKLGQKAGQVVQTGSVAYLVLRLLARLILTQQPSNKGH